MEFARVEEKLNFVCERLEELQMEIREIRRKLEDVSEDVANLKGRMNGVWRVYGVIIAVLSMLFGFLGSLIRR